MSYYYLTINKPGYYKDITKDMYDSLSEDEQCYYEPLESIEDASDYGRINNAKINEFKESLKR